MNNHINVGMCTDPSSRTSTTSESIHYNTIPIKTENPFDRINIELSELKSMLKVLLDRQVKVTEKSDLVDLKEACEILNLSASSIYKRTAKNAIPIIKREGSNKLMFSRLELEKWLKGSQTPPAVSIVDEYLHKNLRIKKMQNN
jgi:predicted DNA-binding transcriptional regulator AlpA